MNLAGISVIVLLAAAIVDFTVRSCRAGRAALARLDAAAAAEAPCPALSHVRLIPRGEDAAALPSVLEVVQRDDDIYDRIMAALATFAAENGYPLPVDTLWMAIAVVTTTAVLGEDLAAVLAGRDMPGGDAS